MITLEYTNAQGDVTASAAHDTEALMCVPGGYDEGGHIILRCPAGSHVMFQPDVALMPGEVYAPTGEVIWPVPTGEARRAYSPALFTPGRHAVAARLMTDDEVAARRNLAQNPADLRGDTAFYPHCTANVETRGESVFAARNVIDGNRLSNGHGDWPFESWGIGARTDAWCMLDFGRDVTIDAMVLTLRADFPHDAWWTDGQVELSDGAVIDFPLQKRGDRQTIALGEHTVRWLRLQNMTKSDDPSAFPSLIQWEVYGRG